jgi:membrane-associated phospholipid phosphatase
MDVLHMIYNFTGVIGPIILYIFGAFILIHKKGYLLFYSIGFIFNVLLNHILKGIFQNPRPLQDNNLFKIELANNKKIGFQKYGMPSGHAQSVGFVIGFLYHILKLKLGWLFILFISIITLSQRYFNKNHYVDQLFIGLIVGLLCGFIFYYLTLHILTGNIKLKLDDNAPI